MVRAGKHGLLFEKMDENGWPIDVRVRRDCLTILQILELWSEEKPDKAVVIREVPRYTEVIEKGAGHFLHNPAKADPKKIYYE